MGSSKGSSKEDSSKGGSKEDSSNDSKAGGGPPVPMRGGEKAERRRKVAR
jgi:hypothetical protein